MKNKMQYLGSDNTFVFGVVLIIVVVAWVFSAWHDHETKKQMQENHLYMVNLLQENNTKLKTHSDSIILMSNKVSQTADSLLEITKEQEVKMNTLAQLYANKFNENQKLRFQYEQLLEDNQSLLDSYNDSLEINKHKDILIDSLKLDNSNKSKQLKQDLSSNVTDSNTYKSVTEDKETRRTRKTKKS